MVPPGVGAEGSAIVTLEEDKSEFADLELVTMAQKQPINSLLVHVGSVQRAGIAHYVSFGSSFDLDMTPRDGYVIEAYFGVRVTAQPGDVFVERESCPGLCSGTHDEYADFGRQLPHRNSDVVIQSWRILQRVYRSERDRPVVERIQWRPAAGTKGAHRWIAVPALVTEDVCSHINSP